MSATTAEKILERCHGRMRTLIVGAGVAGITLAALLRQRGENPALIERADSLNYAGYGLALFPIGSRVLHGLGLYPRFLEASIPAPRYILGNGHGEPIHDFDMSRLFETYGPIQGIRRIELLEILRSGLGDIEIQFGTKIRGVQSWEHAAEVQFEDESIAEFDLVVAADGMHSDLRNMILRENEFEYWDTDWACWAAWAPENILPAGTMAEYWGAGRMVGIYPVRGAQGVVLAGPRHMIEHDGKAGFAEHVHKQFGMFKEPIASVIEAVAKSKDAYFWKLHDCRTQAWSRGRVALAGDAAGGFLPTAGLGATMAMLSAATLADELSRTDAPHMEFALKLYERRERAKVEAAQDTSRKLARLMMIESVPLSWGRDQLMKFYTLDRAMKDITALIEGSV